ncbi:MAG: NlpC/P60 family protein [Syntrophothermus sp.]
MAIAAWGCVARPNQGQPNQKPGKANGSNATLPASPPGRDNESKIDARSKRVAAGSGLINGMVVNVRAKPASDSERLTQVVYNDPVQILEPAGSWLRVRVPDGYEGWIESGQVIRRRGNASNSREARLVVVAPSARLWSQPGSTGKPLLQVVMGTGFAMQEERPGWYLVRLADGQNAWVAAGAVKKLGNQNSEEGGQGSNGGSQNLGQRVAQHAQQLLGVPYLWGGRTPQGIDCSGLAYLAWMLEGIKIPRDARDQFRSGREVSRQELAPGDLVFFNTTGEGASHVGIYAGNNRFIEASQGQKAVVTTSLDAPYYKGRYLGARRYR